MEQKIQKIKNYLINLSQYIQNFKENAGKIVNCEQSTSKLEIKTNNKVMTKEYFQTVFQEMKNQIEVLQDQEKQSLEKLNKLNEDIQKDKQFPEFQKQIEVNIMVWVNNINAVPINFFKYHLFSQVRINQYNYVKVKFSMQQIFDSDDFEQINEQLKPEIKIDSEITAENVTVQVPYEKHKNTNKALSKTKNPSLISKLFCFCSNSSRPKKNDEKENRSQKSNEESIKKHKPPCTSEDKEFENFNQKIEHLRTIKVEQLLIIFLFGKETPEFSQKIQQMGSQTILINSESVQKGKSLKDQTNKKLTRIIIQDYEQEIKDKQKNYFNQLKKQYEMNHSKLLENKSSLEKKINYERNIKEKCIKLLDLIKSYEQIFNKTIEIGDQMIQVAAQSVTNQYDHKNVSNQQNQRNCLIKY